MLYHPLRVSGKPNIVKLTAESFKFWYIFEVQWFTSLLQFVSVTDFYYLLHVLQSNFEFILHTKGYFKVASRW